jgi:hypothetical protein
LKEYSAVVLDPFSTGMLIDLDQLMANESLWEVHGHERVVFDVIREMPFAAISDGEPGVLDFLQ